MTFVIATQSKRNQRCICELLDKILFYKVCELEKIALILEQSSLKIMGICQNFLVKKKIERERDKMKFIPSNKPICVQPAAPFPLGTY